MDSKDRYIARVLFQNKVYRSDGQAYEDLFVSVMTKANPNFRPVKPQGKFGDRKNDGWDQQSGIYYQVYAPEDASQKEKDAIAKLDEDFNGLRAFWEAISPIKEFYFVLNDKYKGAYASLEEALSKIKAKHSLSAAAPFLAKDLENTVFVLKDDEIFTVIGHVPSPDKIENLQYAVLNDVIDHLLKSALPVGRADILKAPDFDEKIKFNKLSDGVSALLTTGSFQSGALDRYFELNSEFTKENIKNVFSSLYAASLLTYAHIQDDAKNDHVFFEILNRALPVGGVVQQSAVLILMSHFFEACDIFEAPVET